ncbi:putative immunity protein [Mycolicibacterium peregrinum]|uniref:putative immunity protein n=1 Tax=Mycolicibacterium peregrinum TaxID=43304 RepID=UPI0039B73572
MDELRVVARFVTETAEEVLSVFEDAHPDDPRPRAAVVAARRFVDGAHRSRAQRVSSLDAHRAAAEPCHPGPRRRPLPLSVRADRQEPRGPAHGDVG